jgi:hypothetical protein
MLSFVFLDAESYVKRRCMQNTIILEVVNVLIVLCLSFNTVCTVLIALRQDVSCVATHCCEAECKSMRVDASYSRCCDAGF